MDKPNPGRLKAIPLFEGLSDEQLRRLAGWLEVGEHEAGKTVVRMGAHGYSFYILETGRARAEVDGVALEDLGPGSVFGEMAFFAPNSRRTATVVAETPVVVFQMFGTYFREMEAELPEVAGRLKHLRDARAEREAAAQADPSA